MRKTQFGSHIIDSVNDDLGDVLLRKSLEAAECYARIAVDGECGLWQFDIYTKDDGDEVASSDPIFAEMSDASDYLEGWIPRKDMEFET